MAKFTGRNGRLTIGGAGFEVSVFDVVEWSLIEVPGAKPPNPPAGAPDEFAEPQRRIDLDDDKRGK